MPNSDPQGIFFYPTLTLMMDSYTTLSNQMLHYIRKWIRIEPVHEISNNVVCATSKASDRPVHMRSLIRALLVTWVYYDC